jgi:siderophore synthetase component
LPETDAVKIVTQLNFQLDMSAPITDEELDQILARLRSNIAATQFNNKMARVLLAKTQLDLLAAYKYRP